MALEDLVPIIPALLSFLPAYIGSKLDNEDRWQRILAWALYALSLLFAMMSVQIGYLVLSRLFGAVPTTTEQGILNLFTYFNLPIIVYFTLFGMLLVLAIIVWFIQYIQSRRFGRTP